MVIIYISLLFFEGIFRKWILLTTTDFFYILRDTLIILAIFFRLMRNSIPNSLGVKILSLLFATLILFAGIQFFFISNPGSVFMLGLKNYFAPVLLLYYLLLSESLDKFLRILFRMAPSLIILETIICVLQALSSRSAFVNLTPTGSTAIVTSGLQVRPLGTFTSSLGFSLFLCFIYSYSLTVFRNWSPKKSFFLFSCIFLDIAISGTRTVPINVLFITLMYFLFLVRGRYVIKIFTVAMLTILLIYISIRLTALINVWDAFQLRLNSQTEGPKGTVSRIWEPILGLKLSDLSFLGDGIGMHHASAFPYLGFGFWIEVESFRWVSELGLMGLFLYIMRIVIPSAIIIRAILKSNFNASHFMLAGLLPFLVFSGITTQPTSQGFAGMYICTSIALRFDSKARLVNHE